MRAALQWLLKSFLKGLLLVVPLTVTAWVFYFVFSKIDGILNLTTPGLGFLITLVFIVAMGAVGSTFLVGRVVAYLESLVRRVPLAKLIYFSLKDFVGAFVGDKKSFQAPVLVALTGEVKVLGFVTADALELPGADGYVAVYLPQSYHFVGNLVLVPRDRVTPLPSSESSKWMAFVVSGGVARGQADAAPRKVPS